MKSEKLIDNSDEKPKNGGARPGAGRPKGSMNADTKLRSAAKSLYQQRVAKNADQLFNAQFTKAIGTQMLFVVHTDSKGVRRKPEMITDVHTITRFLDENKGEDGTMDNDYAADSKAQDYYFITTSPPDNMAISDMLNRSFGKPDEKVDFSSKDGSFGHNHSLTDEELNARIRRILKD